MNEKLPSAGEPLPGRDAAMKVAANRCDGNPVAAPGWDSLHLAGIRAGTAASGEEGLRRMPGVYATSVEYCAGHTKNPTYKEVCSGQRGNEVVRVI